MAARAVVEDLASRLEEQRLPGPAGVRFNSEGRAWDWGNGNYTNPANPVFNRSPRRTNLFIPSLTIDKEFDFMTVKSITSYIDNLAKGYSYQALQSTWRQVTRYNMGSIPCDPTNINTQPRNSAGQPAATGLCYQNGLYLPGALDWVDYFNFRTSRKEWTQEVRFSSNTSGRLTWVAGFYYSDSKMKVRGLENSNDNGYVQRIRGAPLAWFAGAYGLPTLAGATPARHDRHGQIAADVQRHTHIGGVARHQHCLFAATPQPSPSESL